METLYYKMKIRVSHFYVNTGFIKIEVDEKIRMMGILTTDVFVGEEVDDQIYCSYFQCNYQKRNFEKVLEFAIDKEDFQLPQTLEFDDENGDSTKIIIEEKIQEWAKKERCDSIIHKTIDVFSLIYCNL